MLRLDPGRTPATQRAVSSWLRVCGPTDDVTSDVPVSPSAAVEDRAALVV